ncbi:LysR family transcriptional regulator [Nocardia terpenica]|nr:LysR family transcriptional regulator [Nocardia terpenica]MBF6103632.1 LysR family transcriptional regulator [Nocardia terpenica]MBF6111994.1 LysR family transcriptional regulator [Nocardia terpenica]MBF6117853.1 LysR family transcriptional regulator [Nocardia terpenica]MBF6153403.1 LysR family transcriptional regulator [Nocardia terpenica]
MLSLEQVRGFVAVAEEGNFRRAAERLRMTQPPLSRQIQKLERDVGVLLLDRTQRQVELTPAGVVFLAEARRLLALAEAAPGTARRVAAGRVGTVRIGFTATAGFGYLGRFLNRVSQALPEVRLSLSELVSAAQFNELSSGRLDLALARPPFDGAEFAGRRVHREALVLAVPERHRLADRAPIGVPDLDGERMLVYAPGPARYFAELMTRVLAGVSYEPSDRLTQVHTMLALVAAGRGLALVPETAGHLHPDGVRFRPLAGVREQAELYAAWRRDTANPALRRVTDLLEMWPDA